jgi:microcystin-dependent protein
MSWSLFLDQTYTLTPSPTIDSLVIIEGLTGRQIAIRATNPQARPSWTIAARLSFEQTLPEIEADPDFIAETPHTRLLLGRNSLIDVPNSLTPPFKAIFAIPYWHTQMQLEIWEAPLSTAPLPGEYKHLAFDAGVGTWSDENGYLWIVAAGQTIGRAGNGPLFKGEQFKRLYLALWPHYSVSGKTNSAIADWDANRALTLPDLRGRTIISAGQGTNLTNRTIAQVLGAETHTLSVGEMPSHNHSGASGAGAFWMSPGTGGTNNLSVGAGTQHRTAITTGTAGLGQAHNNMQPSIVACTVIATGERG